MRWLFVALVAGCASAEPPGQSGVDSGIGTSDGNEVTLDSDMALIDAMVDAPPGPQMRTLTQTTSQTIKAANSVACSLNDGTGTRPNSYYRVFDLASFGITSDFTVSKVTFQVQHCDQLTGSTGCTVAARVGTYTGTPGATLSNAGITILASNATVNTPEVIENPGPPPSTPGAIIDAPITATIPAGQKLLAQIDVPDGQDLFAFFIGANDGGETATGYVRAPDCGVADPTNTSQAGGVPVHLLLTVTGTY